MLAVSKSVFYFPCPEDPVAENPVPHGQTLDDEGSPYASIDELGGYEPARRGHRESPPDRKARPGPAHVAPSLYEGGYEPIGPRLLAGDASSSASAPQRACDEDDYAKVLPRALRKAADTERFYFELEPQGSPRTPPTPPPQHLKPGRAPGSAAPSVDLAGGLRSQFHSVNQELAALLAKRRVD